MNNKECEIIITVVIPIYNGEKHAESCLNNILSQTYKNLDIIVVNDGSNDRTEEIVRSFPVRIINHETNKGLSAARNSGIDSAKGKYIHFMDVDDKINDVFYENMVKAIIETNADIACSGMIQEHNKYKTQRFTKQAVYNTIKEKLTVTYVGKWGYVWRYLFNLNFLKKNNLRFEEGRFIEDLLFCLPAFYFAKDVVTVPGAEYIYNYTENSILTNKDKTHAQKRRADKRYAKNQILKFAKHHNFKIPGVNTGRLFYILLKFYKNIFT